YPTLGRGELTMLALLAVWILSVCGLSQKPGVDGHYEPESFVVGEESRSQDERKFQSGEKDVQPESQMLQRDQMLQREKYRRSALDETQSARIAQKIETVMAAEKLYLENDLTLSDLAKAMLRLTMCPKH